MEAAFDSLGKKFGKENIMSAVVHMDEAKPHLHFVFAPIVEDVSK